MIKSIGSKKIRTAIFISGAGSNLKNLIKYSKSDKLPIEITYVISNNKNAKGLNFSKKKNIESQFFPFENKKIENKILIELEKRNIDLICLAGFMKILSKNFIKKLKGKF